MLLTEILKASAEKFGDNPALIMRMGYREVSLSYAEVYKLSKKFAVFLKKQGLKRGDKVLILAPNSPYWICSWWGSLLGGYIPVPLDKQSTANLVERIASQIDAKIIFKYLYYKQELPKSLKSHDLDFSEELLEGIDASEFAEPQIDENEIAELMYTSGTTGDPKGVMLTHKNISSNLQSLSPLIAEAKKGISEGDVFLSILPLSHIFEQLAGFLLPFSRGAAIVYAHSPAAIKDLLKEYRVTHMAAVPEFLRIFMNKIEIAAEEKGKKKLFGLLLRLSSRIKIKSVQRLLFHSVHKNFGGRLHTAASGGAPLDPELEKKWDALGIYLLQGYGLTETSPVVATNTYEDRRIGSVGKILPGVEVKIAEDGEIWVKGPNVFQGYFKNKEKTEEAFTSDGWFMTTDIGEMDKDGFLYIKGRKKYMILGPGGQNVYPEDIEFELNKLPGIRDCAVVGLEKPGGAVEIHAVLLLREGALKEVEQYIKQANQRLASYQKIQGWSVWPEEDFPRSATRKVKKEEVLKWLKGREVSRAKAPEGGVKSPLIRLLADLTDRDASEIGGGTKIVPDLNLDSLLRIELISRIEEKLNVALDEAKITSDTTVAELEDMVKGGTAVGKEPPLKNWPRVWLIRWVREISQSLFIFPLLRVFAKIKVEGVENLKDADLPMVFMPNHLSNLDSLVVAAALPRKIRKKISFAAAKDVLYEEYRRFVFWGELFFNAFPFPRKEHENIKAGLEKMGRLLDKNWSVVVYPEGQISLTGELLPLKRGAGLIAVEMGVSVVPIKITGTERILPAYKLFPKRRGVVTVKFGKPLKFSKSDSYIEATEKLRKALADL